MRDAPPTNDGPVPAAELPAEYDVDPTGIGALLGLKEIGEVKREGIEEEAEAARVRAERAASEAREAAAVLAAATDSGSFVAVFDGRHGWSWRNRTSRAVTITLRAEGHYQQLKQLGGS